MPLHPKIRELLDEGKDEILPYLRTPPDLRQWQTEQLILDEADRVPVYQVEDRAITLPDTQLPIRIYRSSDKGNLPILFYVHGGGFVICNLETHDDLCRRLTNHAECITVAVDYRLAPEYKFPIPLYDVYTTAEWIVNNAVSLGGDPSRVAIGGDSAGGNLTAATTLLARDRGGPRFIYQLLIYPVTDYFLPGTPSYLDYATDYGLDRDYMIWFWNHYVTHDQDLDNPYLCPLRAKDLSGLPPAYAMTASYDVLHDEGKQYFDRLKEAGVSVIYENYDDMNHGFLNQYIEPSQQVLQHIGEHLRAVFRA